MSLFSGGEFRDLAFAGERKLAQLAIVPPERKAAVLTAEAIPGLALPTDCDVIIPPAVCHEVGADALAMILQSGVLDRPEPAMVIDFGTNAEIAVQYEGKMVTGSVAAGPAIEGQQISCGTLAVPGAIADLQPMHPWYQTVVLNDRLTALPGPVVDLAGINNPQRNPSRRPVGITGTGVIALIHEAILSQFVVLPHIKTKDQKLHLGSSIEFSEHDLTEAGKAFGALRAGQIAICQEAGIFVQDIATVYLAGASGTYMDAAKAMRLGIVPPRVQTVYHIGNTSLAMARDLAKRPELLDAMSELAERLKKTYCMLAQSPTFKNVFILEYSFWLEGMPLETYQKFLRSYGIPPSRPAAVLPAIRKAAERDIQDVGAMGLKTLAEIGRTMELEVDGCSACGRCVAVCPTKALFVTTDTEPPTLVLKESLCDGVACRRCERACPVKVLAWSDFYPHRVGCKTGAS
jgi:methylamine methyltransferase corrinoid protein reductive activase